MALLRVCDDYKLTVLWRFLAISDLSNHCTVRTGINPAGDAGDTSPNILVGGTSTGFITYFRIFWITFPSHGSPPSLPTVYSILISQPTANITPLKQLFGTCTITSSVQWNHRKYHASAYSTSLLLSIMTS